MITVTCAVIEKDGKILIARRKNQGHFANKWEFPGGKLESGETSEQCLQRELFEELGIEARVGQFIGASTFTYDHAAITLLAFKCLHVSGELTLHEHEEIRWVAAAELTDYDFPEADIPIVKLLMKDIKIRTRDLINPF